MTTTTRYEAEVDTQLAVAWEAYFKATRDEETARDEIHWAVRDRRTGSRNHPTWALTDFQAVTKLQEREPTRPSWERPLASYIEKLTARVDQVVAARAECNRLEALYTGWSRFFIVPGGHIHSSRRCSTCYPTTMFGWLPNLSGLTEADAVAVHGPLLCSVCFPTAPVEWTVGPQSKKEYCSGSDKPATGHRRYAPCSECGKHVAVTSRGLVRKHVR